MDKKLWNEDDDNSDIDDACSFGWNRRRKEVYLKENPSSHAIFLVQMRKIRVMVMAVMMMR